VKVVSGYATQTAVARGTPKTGRQTLEALLLGGESVGASGTGGQAGPSGHSEVLGREAVLDAGVS